MTTSAVSAHGEAIALPFAISSDGPLLRNLIPNRLPRMNAKTGKFGPGRVTIHGESR
jgi:hypothetical protein